MRLNAQSSQGKRVEKLVDKKPKEPLIMHLKLSPRSDSIRDGVSSMNQQHTAIQHNNETLKDEESNIQTPRKSHNDYNFVQGKKKMKD